MTNYEEKVCEMKQKVEEYFDECDRLNGPDGKKIVKPYTLSGLLFYIGLTKKEYENLMGKKKFAEVFIQALAKIEAFIEEKALIGAISSGAAANTLKYSCGWLESKSDKETKEPAKVLKLVLDGELMKLAE